MQVHITTTPATDDDLAHLHVEVYDGINSAVLHFAAEPTLTAVGVWRIFAAVEDAVERAVNPSTATIRSWGGDYSREIASGRWLNG